MFLSLALLLSAFPAFASLPTVEVRGENMRHGARVEQIRQDAWFLIETSAGTEGNQGASFRLVYGPESEEVAAVNAALARPADGAPSDFVFDAIVRRAAPASKLVSLEAQLQWEGGRCPRYPIQPRPAELKNNVGYLDLRREQPRRREQPDPLVERRLSELTPRTTLRVWPTGGASSIERLVLRIGIRADHGSTPEILEIAKPALRAVQHDSPPAGKVALCYGGMPSEGFLRVWSKQGIRARVGLDPAPGEKVAAVYADTLSIPDNDAARIAKYLDAGCIGYFSTGLEGGSFPAALAPYMPVNDWPFRPNLARGFARCEPFSQMCIPTFSRHFDMHLPGSSIESPMVRYEPDKYLRDPKRFTRISAPWKWTNEQERLPLAVDADVGRSRILFLAASYEDFALRNGANGGPGVAWLAEIPFGEKGPDSRPVVENPSEWARRAARDPYAIALEEDEATLAELSAVSPMPREGIDGVTSYRYVYRPGTKPALRVRLRNHFNNIAPLADAVDLGWPENASAKGLNDMAFTHATTRRKIDIHPVWCGRPAETQTVALRWPQEASIAGFRLTGGGSHRFWHRNNPRDFSMAADGAEVFRAKGAEFVQTPAEMRAVYERPVQAVRASALELRVEHLDPKANNEPRRDGPANCSLTEWEVWGWMGKRPTEARTVSLELTVEDLESGKSTTRTLARDIALAPVSEHVLETELPAKNSFGPVRYRFEMRAGDTVLAKRDFDVLFVPAEGSKLVKKIRDGMADGGLLCTPGWRQQDSFGLGMNKWSEGWGGPHDKIWAFEQDLLEMGTRNKDNPARMLTSATGATHYTNPWRRFGNGVYSWDWVAENFLRKMDEGKGRWEDKTSIHIVGSDRWNGVNVATCFGWDAFVDFDLWLRGQGRPGLKGRSREAITREIKEEHGAEWQTFHMRRYADHMLATQKRFADHGFEFEFETHGSFPLCGGELGADLAKTHVGVGTDLFWDLHKQDLWGTIGERIGLVAANPDLRSGAYDEWGWVNSEQNQWWYGSNGDPEIARRQWYATYFLGRVRLDGTFRPYHEIGFGSQGHHGVRYTALDHECRCRVHDLVTQLRPEEPVGYGIVVSWRGQERRMGPKLGRMNFGLYPEDGEADVVDLCQEAYASLVKSGVPIAFVTSTDALKNWKGVAPLLLVDAPNWEDWELEAAQAARARGCEIVSLGEPHATLFNPRAKELLEGAQRIASGEGRIKCPMEVSPGVVVVPFISQGHLFLALCNEGDNATEAHVWLREGFLPLAKGCRRAVCLDEGRAVSVQTEGSELHLSMPLPPSGGRVLMLCRGE